MSAWMNSVYTCWFTNTVYAWFRCILMCFTARFSYVLLLMSSIHSSILIHWVLSCVARLLRWYIISYWNLWLDFYLQRDWQTVPWHASTKADDHVRWTRAWVSGSWRNSKPGADDWFEPWKLSVENFNQWNYFSRIMGMYVFNGMFLYDIIMQDFTNHDDVIKWKHFPRNWPFVRGIHRSRWIPHTKASDAELWCFLWSSSE